MKILICSHFFHPQVGGIETVGQLLAEGFTGAGHEVRVVTQTVEPATRPFPFEILRQPGRRQLLAALRWCDLCLHNNISLPAALPLLWIRRPWVVIHHTWIPHSRAQGFRGMLVGNLKRLALRFAHSVSISSAIADDLPVASKIIPNPYQDDLFRLIPEVPREKDLVFMGRLVSDKGADLLIQALAELRQQGLEPSLTIIGSGPEEPALRTLACDLGVERQISFAGVRMGTDLASLLNEHKIIVIPSRWAEPFGLVALEGIACGCMAIGSEQGGLSDAIGPCGLTFPNGDAAALAQQLEKALTSPTLRATLLAGAEEHLRPHRKQAVVAAYLELMAGLVARASHNSHPSH